MDDLSFLHLFLRYTQTYIYMWVCVCMHIYIYIYVYVHAYTHTYIYKHTWISLSGSFTNPLFEILHVLISWVAICFFQVLIILSFFKKKNDSELSITTFSTWLWTHHYLTEKMKDVEFWCFITQLLLTFLFCSPLSLGHLV